MAIGPIPDDLVFEYNMLHLMDDGDGVATSLSTDTPTSPAAFSHVEELLPNCSVGASLTSSTTSASNASCASLTCASGSASVTVVHTKEGEAITLDEVAAFLLDGEQFLHDMEKVVTLDWTDANQTDQTNQTNQTAHKRSNEAMDDFDTFTDLEMESSPCPSTCPSSMGGRWSTVDADEVEGVCFPPMEMQKKEEKKKKEEEQANGVSRDLYGLPPVSPLKLAPREESLTGISDAQSLRFTNGGVSATPFSQMLKEEECQKENEGVSATLLSYMMKDEKVDAEEDEMEDEEVMEDEINLLAKEVKYLDAQMDFLQSRAKSSRVRRKSVKQRRSCGTQQSTLLPKSQEDNHLLNELVAQQKIYQDNFKAMLALAPVVDVRMALMTPIESYIRLGKDFDERRETILSLREEKLDMTYKFIEQKAAGIDVNQPYQYSDMFEKFGKHYSVDFAVSKYDGVTVFQVSRAIYEQIAGKDEALNSVMGSTTTREPFDTIKCNFLHQRIVSSMKWEGQDAGKMPDMESNAIFYCRFGDNSAVLATDYIDQDELHPYDTSNCIRKDVSSGVVLSGHTDADGNKYVVMKRYLMARYHMYPHKVSQKQQDRYFASMPKCHDTIETLIADRLQRDDTCCPCTGNESG